MTGLPAGLARPRPPHSPTPTPASPPVGPFLRNPEAFIHSVIHKTGSLLAAYGWASGILIACTAVIYLTLRHLWWATFP